MSHDFHTTNMKKARKAHVCEGCGQAIDIGEYYVKNVGKWDGDFYSFAAHRFCDDARSSLWLNYPEDAEVLSYRECVHTYVRDFLKKHGLWEEYKTAVRAENMKRHPHVRRSGSYD